MSIPVTVRFETLSQISTCMICSHFSVRIRRGQASDATVAQREEIILKDSMFDVSFSRTVIYSSLNLNVMYLFQLYVLTALNMMGRCDNERSVT